MQHESGGLLWPLFTRLILFSIVMSHMTLIGIFGLKRGYLQILIMTPLLLFTVASISSWR